MQITIFKDRKVTSQPFYRDVHVILKRIQEGASKDLVKKIRNIKNAYKYLYKSDLRIEEAIEKISSLTEISDEVTVMIDFLNQSSRGIVR